MENEILKIIKNSVGKSVQEALTKYNSPFVQMVDNVIRSHKDEIESIVNECVSSLVNSKDFKKEINLALKQKLAKNLVSKFGGELEKSINTLKSNPATRAKIILAIENITEELLKE